jgi:phage baseplate assembly protein W
MAISFKSVGKTSTQTQKESASTVITETPIGIMTPLRLGSRSEGIFKMMTPISDVIADNFRNLILTNWGERIGQYNFGANIRELMTEIVSHDNFDNEAMTRIKSAVERWMPYVSLIDFSSTIDNQFRASTGKIVLDVTYVIPGVQELPRTIRVDLYII